MTSRLFAVTIATASLAVIARSSIAQAAADRGAFIIIQRGDTVAIERFARTPDSVNVDLTVKMQARFVYVAKTARDFTIPQIALQVYLLNAPADAPPAQSAILTMKGDSVIAEITAGGQSQTQRIKTITGAVMIPPSSIAAFEQLTMKARAFERASAGKAIETSHPYTIPVFATAGGATLNATVVGVGADSMVVNVAGQDTGSKSIPSVGY